MLAYTGKTCLMTPFSLKKEKTLAMTIELIFKKKKKEKHTTILSHFSINIYTYTVLLDLPKSPWLDHCLFLRKKSNFICVMWVHWHIWWCQRFCFIIKSCIDSLCCGGELLIAFNGIFLCYPILFLYTLQSGLILRCLRIDYPELVLLLWFDGGLWVSSVPAFEKTSLKAYGWEVIVEVTVEWYRE